MEIDARDGLTIAFASFGSLLGALGAFAFHAEHVALWSFGGLILGSAFCAYFLSRGGY